MDYNREHLSNLLARVKLTNSDLARLLGVSRVTVYNWLRNGTPHRMVAGKLTKVTEALERAEGATAEREALATTVRELSVRVVPILEDVVLVLLVGEIDDQHAQALRRQLLDGIAQVLVQMPAVGHVDSLRCPTSSTCRVNLTAIPADNFDTGVGLQRGREAVFGAVWQEVNRQSPLQIDQDGLHLTSTPEGPVVDAQHARRESDRQGLPPQADEEGVRADGEAKFATEPGPAFTTKGKTNRDLLLL